MEYKPTFTGDNINGGTWYPTAPIPNTYPVPYVYPTPVVYPAPCPGCGACPVCGRKAAPSQPTIIWQSTHNMQSKVQEGIIDG